MSDIDVPAGQPADMNASNGLAIDASLDQVSLSQASIAVVGEVINTTPSDFDLEGVDFGTVSTVGLESSPLADAPAGLRANEHKHDHDFTVKPASEAEATTEWIHRILKEDRNIVITSHK